MTSKRAESAQQIKLTLLDLELCVRDVAGKSNGGVTGKQGGGGEDESSRARCGTAGGGVLGVPAGG